MCKAWFRPWTIDASPPAARNSEINCIWAALGRPRSDFSSRANARPSWSRTRSDTPGRTPKPLKIAASTGLRRPPFGVCHQTRPLAPRWRRCWQTARWMACSDVACPRPAALPFSRADGFLWGDMMPSFMPPPQDEVRSLNSVSGGQAETGTRHHQRQSFDAMGAQPHLVRRPDRSTPAARAASDPSPLLTRAKISFAAHCNSDAPSFGAFNRGRKKIPAN